MLRLIPYARSHSDCLNVENLYTIWRTVRCELCSSIKAYKKWRRSVPSAVTIYGCCLCQQQSLCYHNNVWPFSKIADAIKWYNNVWKPCTAVIPCDLFVWWFHYSPPFYRVMIYFVMYRTCKITIADTVLDLRTVYLHLLYEFSPFYEYIAYIFCSWSSFFSRVHAIGLASGHRILKEVLLQYGIVNLMILLRLHN